MNEDADLDEITGVWSFHEWLMHNCTYGAETYLQWVDCGADITLTDWVREHYPHLWVAWRMQR